MKSEKKLLIIILFNITILSLEIIGGIISRSLALLSDAGHMLTDSMALLLSYFAIIWSKKPATSKRTFGYYRMEIITALINGIVLAGIATYIFYEAIARFFNPIQIKTNIVLVIASIGLSVNLLGILILKKEKEKSLNIRSAFLHLLGDTFSSLGVIIGGITIIFTGWYIVDSIIGIMIGLIVLRGAISLISDSGEILLESTPKDISVEQLKKDVEDVRGVKEFYEIHVWTITSNKRALSGHILIDNISTRKSQDIIFNIKKLLDEKYNISHSTLEVQCDKFQSEPCEYKYDCNDKDK